MFDKEASFILSSFIQYVVCPMNIIGLFMKNKPKKVPVLKVNEIATYVKPDNQT